MNKLWNNLILLRGSYDAMKRGEQMSAIFHLSIDIAIFIFFVAEIIVGLTQDFNAFYFWVPFLAVILWIRFKQARQRWHL